MADFLRGGGGYTQAILCETLRHKINVTKKSIHHENNSLDCSSGPAIRPFRNELYKYKKKYIKRPEFS